MRVVLDTNVLLAAFATRGLCEELVAVCLTDHEIVVSEHILAELRRTLSTKIKIPAARAREIEELIRDAAVLVRPTPVSADACADRDDLPVLGTAVAATADALVTGDRELLDLRHVHGIPILSPREFYERLR